MAKETSRRRPGAFAACCALLCACAAAAPANSPGVAADVPRGGECNFGIDCADKFASCINGFCQPGVGCQTDAACVSGGKRCDTKLGKCVQCLADADCGAGQFCANDACVAVFNEKCASIVDCPLRGYCDVAHSKCYQCVNVCDAKYEICQAGMCVPSPNGCYPDARVCVGKELRTCNATGDGFASQTCGGGCANGACQ